MVTTNNTMIIKGMIKIMTTIKRGTTNMGRVRIMVDMIRIRDMITISSKIWGRTSLLKMTFQTS